MSVMENCNTLTTQPKEILGEIFSWVPFSERHTVLKRVCKLFKEVVEKLDKKTLEMIQKYPLTIVAEIGVDRFLSIPVKDVKLDPTEGLFYLTAFELVSANNAPVLKGEVTKGLKSHTYIFVHTNILNNSQNKASLKCAQKFTPEARDAFISGAVPLIDRICYFSGEVNDLSKGVYNLLSWCQKMESSPCASYVTDVMDEVESKSNNNAQPVLLPAHSNVLAVQRQLSRFPSLFMGRLRRVVNGSAMSLYRVFDRAILSLSFSSLGALGNRGLNFTYRILARIASGVNFNMTLLRNSNRAAQLQTNNSQP